MFEILCACLKVPLSKSVQSCPLRTVEEGVGRWGKVREEVLVVGDSAALLGDGTDVAGLLPLLLLLLLLLLQVAAAGERLEE